MSRHRTVNVFLRGSLWWTWFYDHQGKKVRRSTRQKDRALALKAAELIQREHMKRAAEGPSITIEDALSQFLANVERKGREEATLEYYVRKCKPLLRVLGASTNILSLDLRVTNGYLDEREAEGVSRATIVKELVLLTMALRVAAKHGLYPRDPKLLMPFGTENSYVPRDRVLTENDYRQLRANIAPDRRMHLDLLTQCGMRAGEVERLRVGDVDVTNARLRAPGKKGRKDRAERWIPIPPDLEEALTEQLEGRKPDEALLAPWTNQRRALRTAAERVGIPPLSANDLRRSFATWLAERGVPEMITAALMGHANSGMVRRVYARIGDDAKRVAMATMPRFNVLGPPSSDTAPAPPTTPARNHSENTVTLIVHEGADATASCGRISTPRSTPRNDETPCFQGVSEVPRGGIEPSTRGFSIHCSTN